MLIAHVPGTASWKSSPASQCARARLRVEPEQGDDYPADLVVFAFPGGAGTVEDNLSRWQRLFKDKDGNPPKMESKKVKGKNIEVTTNVWPLLSRPVRRQGRARPAEAPACSGQSSWPTEPATTSEWSVPTRR